MDEISQVTTALTVAFGLSLVVERVLEVTKHLFDLAGRKEGAQRDELLKSVKQAVAEARQAFADVRSGDVSIPEALSEQPLESSSILVEAATDRDAPEQSPPPPIGVEAATPPDESAALRSFYLQAVGLGLGMILADLFDLQLFNTFMDALHGLGEHELSPLTDTLLTGVVIGGGSKPVHLLIRIITERRVPQENAPAPASRPAYREARAENVDWHHVDYHGGVDPQALENSHPREDDPDLIVLHHTAMSSTSSFQDVVDQFHEQGLATGYHCVVMPDGQLRFFCRWDRAGNHTEGFNGHSLGLAFHGNFETAANGRFSNIDGRYGNQQPTDEQLQAGARIAAAWCLLYPEIGKRPVTSIRTHRDLRGGHCPGSNFPEQAFRRQLANYLEGWRGSAYVAEEIAALGALPRVHVKQED